MMVWVYQDLFLTRLIFTSLVFLFPTSQGVFQELASKRPIADHVWALKAEDLRVQNTEDLNWSQPQLQYWGSFHYQLSPGSWLSVPQEWEAYENGKNAWACVQAPQPFAAWGSSHAQAYNMASDTWTCWNLSNLHSTNLWKCIRYNCWLPLRQTWATQAFSGPPSSTRPINVYLSS